MSNDLSQQKSLPPTSPVVIDRIRQVEALSLQRPQVDIETSHLIHDGIYTRTICVPAGVMITGALIKIPTTLTVSGECVVLIGEGDSIEIKGFAVIPASSGRKQVFIAISDTHISMSFKTDARNIKDAEAEFTDETEILKSNTNKNNITITED